MQFERNINASLLAWKNSPQRKPLVLQGPRQVGKTHLLKTLGKTAFTHTAYFNFEEQPGLKQFFESTKDVKRILQNLSLLQGAAIEPAGTLIIFDEIQECNEALNSLKYFNETAPEYAIAAAGSLLGITLSKPGSFPVGKVNFMEVYPLSFTEWLAVSNAPLASYLQQLSAVEQVPDIFFQPLLEQFRNYFISGGMPEAAATLLEGMNIDNTEKVLKEILQAYSLDFAKHAPAKDIARIDYVWKSVPGQLAKENKKFLYQVVKPGARAREYEDALLWLVQAGLVRKVPLCKKPALPLPAYDDLSAFKLYLADTGLLRKLAGLDPMIFADRNNIFTEFKGALTENYILQSLTPQFEVPLRYWASEGKAEVDFLIQYKNIIIPCEVKAEENIQSKSLSVYHQKFAPPLRIRFSLKNLSYDAGLLNIPLFLADHTRYFIDMVIAGK